MTTDSPAPVNDETQVPAAEMSAAGDELESTGDAPSAAAETQDDGVANAGTVGAPESEPAEFDSKPSRGKRRLIVAGVAVAVAVIGWFGFIELQFYRVRTFLQKRDAEAAIATLESLEELRSNDSEVAFLMARASRRLGRMEQTRKWLEKALDRGCSPKRVQREQWLAMAQDGQIPAVEQHLWDMLRQPDTEDFPEICEAYVNGYMINYHVGRAVDVLHAWQQDYPDDPQPVFLKGRVMEHRGQRTSATKLFEEALALDPDRVDIRIHLAKALTNLNRFDEAQQHYEKLKSITGNPDLLSDRAYCLIQIGEYDRAMVLLKEALALEPDHVMARLRKAKLDHEAGDNGLALPVLKQLHEEHPRDSDIRYVLGQALRSDGQLEEAAGHFEYVTQANKAFNEAMHIIDFLSEQPNDAEARCNAGKLLLKAGDLDAGLLWLRSTLQSDPDYAPAHKALAAYYREQGQDEMADQHEEHLKQLAEDGLLDSDSDSGAQSEEPDGSDAGERSEATPEATSQDRAGS